MSARPKLVTPHLPHPALPQADWADCYVLEVHKPGLTALEAARLAVGHFPWWVRGLMSVRNAVVGLFGLKPSTYHSAKTTRMIGIFPVISVTDREAVLGFDDTHLDFRIVIDVGENGAGRQTVSATTLVNRKILLGKIYIAVITPFHKLVVSSMLSRVGRMVGGVS